MRVAIAGSGGLAYWIAFHVRDLTSCQIIILSRNGTATLSQYGFQALTVNFNDPASLDYALTGVDVVISTIRDKHAQINLINVAVHRNVKRFVPAEFEGMPAMTPPDLVDEDRAAVREHLRALSGRIEWTIFVCGLFYEHFGPGGIQRSRIGMGSSRARWDFMVDAATMRAEIPLFTASNQHVALSLTGASDVGRFVAKSLELPRWPPQLTMQGDRLTTSQLLQTIAAIRGQPFAPRDVRYHTATTLRDASMQAHQMRDARRARQCSKLLAVQNGMFDVQYTELNARFPAVIPSRFDQWLRSAWAT